MFIPTHYRGLPRMNAKQRERLYWLVEDGHMTEKEFSRVSYSIADYFARTILFNTINNRIKETGNQHGIQ